MGGGGRSTMDSVLASHPAARVLFSAFPKEIYSLDVAEINRQQLSTWTVRNNYVDWTHRALLDSATKKKR